MKLVLRKLLLLVLLCSWQFVDTARILAFFPMPWKSHQFFVRPFLKGLVNKGHQVDFYTSYPMSEPPIGLTQYAVKDQQSDVVEDLDLTNFYTTPFQATLMLSQMCLEIMTNIFEQEDCVKDLLRSNHSYDAVITEFPVGTEATAYLAHKFNALSIAIMGFPDDPWVNELSGLPDNPSYMISYQNAADYKLSFKERLMNSYITVLHVLACYYALYTMQQPFADKYIKYESWETRPKLIDLVTDAALIITNAHVSSTHPYPRAPQVKGISGLHLEPKALPKDLQAFMDDAPHGIIYFSFGSLVNPKTMLANGKFQIFLDVFKKLKQKVMWKVPADMLTLGDPKIRLQTWFPQQDVLGHKNVVLFITHGGMQSMLEAINYGVPCLGMPVLHDQYKDVKFTEYVGMGLPLMFDNITEATVSWSINELLFNPYYRDRAKKQQALFKDRPMKPVDEAVYWIEYVLRQGKVLQPASAKMPFYQVYLLDVLGVILLGLSLLLWTIRRILTTVSSILRKSGKNKSTLKKKVN